MAKEYVKTVYRLKLERIAKHLEGNQFAASVFDTKEEAAAFLKQVIPPGSSVGIGGSVTLDEMGVVKWLRSDPEIRFIDRYSMPDKKQAFRESLLADVYLMSSNAVTMDGYLYNVDGTGNRVAALIYGPDKVYVACGRNKIVKDAEEAKSRVEEIAAPANCARLEKENPCTKTGSCMHCSLPTTICNQFVLSRRSGVPGRIHVLLINEELGL
ncbi:MAG: lactate utilization protein [Solobacterium sp.]|nr:lactate utilization protein [Solobacterium sp.]